MRINLGESGNCFDYIRRLVHNDYCTRSKTRLSILERVEVHQDLLALGFWQNRYGAATRYNTKKIIPSTPDTTTVLLNEVLEWNAHLFFDDARAVDVS